MTIRRKGTRVRLFTRGRYDWADRFPAIAAAARRLTSKSFVIDGKLVCCGEDGIADFETLRSRWNDGAAFVYAFDLVELDGEDLRALAVEDRKSQLAPAQEGGARARVRRTHRG